MGEKKKSTSGSLMSFGPFRPVALNADGINHSSIMASVFTDYWYIFVGAATLYLPLVYFGQKFMEKREPVRGLQHVMFVWNGGLAVISAIMFYRCFATGYVQSLFRDHSLHEALCMNRHFGIDYGTAWAFNWMAYTKVIELGDTAFLVLRKKPIMTLHWFHHLTVLLFVWAAQVY